VKSVLRSFIANLMDEERRGEELTSVRAVVVVVTTVSEIERHEHALEI